MACTKHSFITQNYQHRSILLSLWVRWQTWCCRTHCTRTGDEQLDASGNRATTESCSSGELQDDSLPQVMDFWGKHDSYVKSTGSSVWDTIISVSQLEEVYWKRAIVAWNKRLVHLCGFMHVSVKNFNDSKSDYILHSTAQKCTQKFKAIVQAKISSCSSFTLTSNQIRYVW